MARPRVPFDQVLADEICFRLSAGESLLSMTDSGLIKEGVVFQWLHEREDFRGNYARARESWAESEFEKLMAIADTPLEGEKTEEGSTEKGSFSKTIRGDMIEHRRLQVDTRKWALARMFPKKYGDRINQQLTGADGETLKIEVTGIRPTKENT